MESFAIFIFNSPNKSSVYKPSCLRTAFQPVPVYSGYRSNSPLSIAGWIFDVPPPTPCVSSTFKSVSCSIRMSSISPRIYCSVIGFVAICMVSFCGIWIMAPPTMPKQRTAATAAIILLVLFAFALCLRIRFSMKPRIKSIARASKAISKLPAIVIAALLVVMPR